MMFCKYSIFIKLALNHQYFVAFLLTIFLIAVQGRYISESQNCSEVSDCACGEQCVDLTNITSDTDVRDLRLCDSLSCECRRGCAVADIFIPAGVNRPNTYCNLCGCPSAQSDGIPWCTRVAWCDLPKNVPIHHNNPACPVQPEINSLSEE